VEQTADRAATLAPVRGTVAAPQEAAGPLRTCLPHEFVVALLPVRGARELAMGLARQWQIWSGATAAVVGLGHFPSARKFVAQSRRGELPHVAQSALDRQQAEAGFRSLVPAESRTLANGEVCVAALAFPTGADAIGGVWLYSPDRLELPREACEQFASLSGALLSQAAVIEESSSGLRGLEVAKAEALAEFSAGAGHEINNPLATISGRVQILLRDETDANRRQDLATIGAQALRVRDMIGDLMVYGRPPAPNPERLLLNDLAKSVIDRFAETARFQSCGIRLAAAGPVFVTADPTQLRVVLSELVRNSLEAAGATSGVIRRDPLGTAESRGEIVVRLERTMSGENAAAILSVTDNGPGLTEKDRTHLFDPFYSGRNAGRGLGFGLCKCRRIVSGHGGTIEVDSVPHVATTFRVIWPDEPPCLPTDPAEASLLTS
jgi:signal transduction histidine kinase